MTGWLLPSRLEGRGRIEEDERWIAPSPIISRGIAASRWARENNSPEFARSLPRGRRKLRLRKRSSTSESDKGLVSSGQDGGPLTGLGFGVHAEPGECEEDHRELKKRKLTQMDGEDLVFDDEEERKSELEHKRDDVPPAPQQTLQAIGQRRACRSVAEFEKLEKIGEGRYGVVFRARNKKTGEIVAMKNLKMEDREEGFSLSFFREISILSSLHHPYVVDSKEVVVGSTKEKVFPVPVFLVMEYLEHDLKRLMKGMKRPFSRSEVKCLLLQLLLGVKHLHDNRVLHRDLKTSNLLVNSRGELKICDFGMARRYGNPLKAYTNEVVTLWYRAPELLLGPKNYVYSTALDMWSVGCIMAELLAKEPLFKGKSEIDQIGKIFGILGTPNEETWPEFPRLLGAKFDFARRSSSGLRERFPAAGFTGGATLTRNGFDLLQRFLTYDPRRRITAEEALKHDWFREFPLPQEFMPDSLFLDASPCFRHPSCTKMPSTMD